MTSTPHRRHMNMGLRMVGTRLGRLEINNPDSYTRFAVGLEKRRRSHMQMAFVGNLGASWGCMRTTYKDKSKFESSRRCRSMLGKFARVMNATAPLYEYLANLSVFISYL
jgi:hypothetical protein